MRLFSIIAILILAACSQSKDLVQLNSYENAYNVYKVDSLHSYYIIMASKENRIFKIISRKTPGYTLGTKISEGKKYEFMLYSIWNSKAPHANPKALALSEIMGCFDKCLDLDDSTSFCTDRNTSIYDLFIAENVKGLYAGKEKIVDGNRETSWKGSR